MYFTRIVNLPKHDRVLVGRDIDEVFKRGMVYGFKRCNGEIIAVELGETSLAVDGPGFPNQNSTVHDIIVGSPYLLTKKETDFD